MTAKPRSRKAYDAALLAITDRASALTNPGKDDPAGQAAFHRGRAECDREVAALLKEFFDSPLVKGAVLIHSLTAAIAYYRKWAETYEQRAVECEALAAKVGVC